MAKYKISGIWKTSSGITHYAFHTVNPDGGVTRGVKTTKAEAVRLLSQPGNSAITWLWDYKAAFWRDGEKVEVIAGSYLRSNPDGTVRDNLAHLINYEWL